MVNFNIPSQPLSMALTYFGEQSDFAVMADSALLQGKYSSEVHGLFLPQDALKRVLLNTGLTMRQTSRNAFTVLQKNRKKVSVVTGSIAGDISAPGLGGNRFGAMLQESVARQLCAATVTRPGQYRAVIQLWLEDAGRVKKVRLINSTGKLSRDEEIIKRISRLHLELPNSLPQPLTVLITPETSPSVTCPSSNAELH